MKKNLVSKLVAGALVFASVLPLAGSVAAYADSNAKSGWVMENGNWCYYNDNGEKLKDTTVTIKDKQYQFGANGEWIESAEQKKEREEQEAKIQDGIKKYKEKYPETKQCSEAYKKSDDRWSNKDGKWYYNSKYDQIVFGALESDSDYTKDDWELINGYWYHFDKDGVMEKNITIKDECNNDCILNSDGVLTNRNEPQFKEDAVIDKHQIYTKKTENGNDYYVNDKGEKKIGWVMDEEDHKWHYTNADGIAQKNTTITKNGKSYQLDANGAWNN